MKGEFIEDFISNKVCPLYNPIVHFPFGEVYDHLDSGRLIQAERIDAILAATLKAVLPGEPAQDHELLALIGGRFIVLLAKHNPVILQQHPKAMKAARRIGLFSEPTQGKESNP